jgi:hypothetical protein
MTGQFLAAYRPVICRINTHACVRSTVLDAFIRDFQVWILRRFVASYDQAGHKRSLDRLSRRMARVVGLEEVLKRIHKQDLTFRLERRRIGALDLPESMAREVDSLTNAPCSF